MDEGTRREAAELLGAYRTCEPVEPLREKYEFPPTDAYATQQLQVHGPARCGPGAAGHSRG